MKEVSYKGLGVTLTVVFVILLGKAMPVWGQMQEGQSSGTELTQRILQLQQKIAEDKKKAAKYRHIINDWENTKTYSDEMIRKARAAQEKAVFEKDEFKLIDMFMKANPLAVDGGKRQVSGIEDYRIFLGELFTVIDESKIMLPELEKSIRRQEAELQGIRKGEVAQEIEAGIIPDLSKLTGLWYIRETPNLKGAVISVVVDNSQKSLLGLFEGGGFKCYRRGEAIFSVTPMKGREAKFFGYENSYDNNCRKRSQTKIYIYFDAASGIMTYHLPDETLQFFRTYVE